MSESPLSAAEIEEAHLTDWRLMNDALHTRFGTGNFATGLRLVNMIGAAAEEANHHPDLDLRYPHLDVHLASHDAGGVTARDIRLARRISKFAAEVGATPQPERV